MENNLPFWIMSVGFLPVLIIGVVVQIRKNREKSRKILISCIGLGVFFVAAYTAYATINYGLNPVDVALGLTDSKDVKNIWGVKRFIYLIPIGYVFIFCGLILAPIYWSNKNAS